MRKLYKSIIDVLLYVWQLPQNFLGLCLMPFYYTTKRIEYKTSVVRICPSFRSGISLGRYIYLKYEISNHIKHEYGHSIQSKMLGPLYLLIVGLPSISHNMFCKCISHKHRSYYNWYCEKWADKLGGVLR